MSLSFSPPLPTLGRFSRLPLLWLRSASLIACLLLPSLALAGGPKRTVNLADVWAVAPAQRDTLAPLHHAVALAEAEAAGTRAMVDSAGENTKLAKKELDAKKAALDAAKAEKKAAQAASDGPRAEKAEGSIKNAEMQMQAVESMVAWNKQEAEARKAEAEKAEAGLLMRQCELEHARVTLVVGADASQIRGQYVSTEFRTQLDEAIAAFNKKATAAEKARRDADMARGTWEKMKAQAGMQ